MKKVALALGIIIAGLGAVTGAIAATTSLLSDPTSWTTVTTWHYPPAPGADFIFKRQVGTGYGDTPDDTIPVTLDSSTGSITEHSSGWEPVDVTQFGVPPTATAVQLQFKAVITAGTSGFDPDVFAFVKQDGSDICPGPPGSENYPVDYTWSGEAQNGGEKCWAIHGAISANGVREFNTVVVPVVNGVFDVAWGYRRTPGTWPHGDAVAVDIWLDGWAS